MKWHRIYALIVRHTLPLKRDFDLLSDMLYWPFIDVITWGIASQWLTKDNSGVTNSVISILVALVIWNVIWRSQSEVSRNLIDEIWNNNLINMFSTPLTLLEWITSVLLQSIAKMFVTVSFVSLAIFVLYTVNAFAIGWWMLPFFLSATLTGWTVGFIAAGIVIRYGPKMQTVVWTLPGILFPLSAVFYPASQLPIVFKQVSLFVPTTYIFEAMRSLIFSGSVPMENIIISFSLNIVYLILAILFFVRKFKKSKELNFSRFNN